jgi:mannose-1-phosphate guanylyltransferase/phosphomannomutase
VLSLNAYTDEQKLMTARPSREESLERLGQVVKSFNADLGLLFDNGAERLSVVDGQGSALVGSHLLLVLTELVTGHVPPGKVAVPVNQPSVLDRVAAARGFEVLKTRVDRSHLMGVAREKGVVFAGSGDGGFIFPEFMPAYDALMTFAKLLEMLASRGESLSELVNGLPAYYLERRQVFTSWESKGTVMRQLLEANQGPEVDSMDGIKISWGNTRWVLIQPDQDEPVLHIYAEGESEEDCREILDKYEEEIKRSIAAVQ